jgi:hypothetical protein
MDLCLQVIINKFEAPMGTAEMCSVSDVLKKNCFLSQAIGLGPAAD